MKNNCFGIPSVEIAVWLQTASSVIIELSQNGYFQSIGTVAVVSVEPGGQVTVYMEDP